MPPVPCGPREVVRPFKRSLPLATPDEPTLPQHPPTTEAGVFPLDLDRELERRDARERRKTSTANTSRNDESQQRFALHARAPESIQLSLAGRRKQNRTRRWPGQDSPLSCEKRHEPILGLRVHGTARHGKAKHSTLQHSKALHQTAGGWYAHSTSTDWPEHGLFKSPLSWYLERILTDKKVMTTAN